MRDGIFFRHDIFHICTSFFVKNNKFNLYYRLNSLSIILIRYHILLTVKLYYLKDYLIEI